MLVHAVAIVGLALLCGAWALLPRRGGCGGCGGCDAGSCSDSGTDSQRRRGA